MSGVIYGDMVATVIAKLTILLAARPEPFASGVTVTNRRGETGGRVVVITESSGAGESNTLDDTSLRVNVYTDDEGDCADLTNLVRALLTSPAPSGVVDGKPIVLATKNAGPNVIDDETGAFRRYMVINIRRRGTNLAP